MTGPPERFKETRRHMSKSSGSVLSVAIPLTAVAVRPYRWGV